MTNTTSTKHPMWLVDFESRSATVQPSDKTTEEGSQRVGSHEGYWLRAPTASAALARAEALRAGKPEPVAATAPTIRVRCCIAVVNGEQWGVSGFIGWNDDDAKENAQEVAGLFGGDHLQIDYATIEVPLRAPAELTGAVETKEE